MAERSIGLMTSQGRDAILSWLVASPSGPTIAGTLGMVATLTGAMVFIPNGGGVIDGTLGMLVTLTGEMVFTPQPALYPISGSLSPVITLSGNVIFTPA